MGTRFVIMVKEDGETVGAIYGQYDGYPDGYPYDVLKFLSERELVNGYNDPLRQVNGSDDMVAMIFAYLKIRTSDVRNNGKRDLPEGLYAGTIYAYQYDRYNPIEDGYIDYVYVIDVPLPTLGEKIPVSKLNITVYNFGKQIFRGTIGEFLENFSHETLT